MMLRMDPTLNTPTLKPSQSRLLTVKPGEPTMLLRLVSSVYVIGLGTLHVFIHFTNAAKPLFLSVIIGPEPDSMEAFIKRSRQTLGTLSSNVKC